MIARRARPEEWERVKELRLRALREEPTAFHARYEDEVEEPDFVRLRADARAAGG